MSTNRLSSGGPSPDAAVPAQLVDVAGADYEAAQVIPWPPPPRKWPDKRAPKRPLTHRPCG